MNIWKFFLCAAAVLLSVTVLPIFLGYLVDSFLRFARLFSPAKHYCLTCGSQSHSEKHCSFCGSRNVKSIIFRCPACRRRIDLYQEFCRCKQPLEGVWLRIFGPRWLDWIICKRRNWPDHDHEE